MKPQTNTQLLTKIKRCIWIMIIGLLLSGVTAFPIETELNWLVNHAHGLPQGMQSWLGQVHTAVKITNAQYQFLSYGTDWLAFAHVMLALLFIGPLKDPVKNVWVIQFGILACVCIFPLAFVAGSIRGIPVFWRWIDCSFGIIGIIPLSSAYQCIRQLAGKGFNHQPYSYEI